MNGAREEFNKGQACRRMRIALNVPYETKRVLLVKLFLRQFLAELGPGIAQTTLEDAFSMFSGLGYVFLAAGRRV
jgi:hypothetical protein